MRRTRHNKIAILTSDWHLREDAPDCRTDDFWEVQWGKVQYISNLQKKYKCPVLHGGDLFHHWKPSPFLLAMAFRYLPDHFYTIYGQHDLPNHNYELRNKSGIYTLEMGNRLKVIDGGHWGSDWPGSFYDSGIGVWHKFIWDGDKLPWPGCEELTAVQALKKYNKDFDLILTGDHHRPFTQKYKGSILVNPGSLSRQASDYALHKPRVYLYDGETVIPHYIPISVGVVSDVHVQLVREREDRLSAFIERINTDWEVTLSFQDNLNRFFSKNKVHPKVKKIIYESLE